MKYRTISQRVRRLLSKAEEMLGAEDLVVNKLKTAISVYKNTFDDIVLFIDRGIIIEEFQLK